MDHAAWQGCQDPQLMLDFLRSSGALTERGARFFAIALCRHLWPLLTDCRSREGVEVAERYAAALVDVDDLHRAANRAADAFGLVDQGPDEDAAIAAEAVCCALTAPDMRTDFNDFARYFVPEIAAEVKVEPADRSSCCGASSTLRRPAPRRCWASEALLIRVTMLAG